MPDGWFVNESFGSKGSFFREDGIEHARTNIYRYVAKEQKDEY